MANKKKGTDVILIAIVGIIGLMIIIFLVASLGNIVTSGTWGGEPKFKLICNGEIIHTLFLGRVSINSFNCITKKQGFLTFSQEPLIFAKEGQLILQVSGKRRTQSWKCGLGKLCDFTIVLKDVEIGSTWNLKLLDKKGQIIDKKEGTV